MEVTQLRDKNGRFVKKNVYDRIKNASANRTLQAARIREAKKQNDEMIMNKCPVVGRRIIDIKQLCKSMWCKNCERALCFRDVEDEKICGLASIFYIRCTLCQTVYTVPSSGNFESEIRSFRHEVNAKLAAGVINAGIETSQLNTLLTAINVPALSNNFLKRANEVEPTIKEEVAKKICQDVPQEES